MPDRLELVQTLFDLMQLAFAFAFGACLGSLVNVLAYRMPRGLGVVTPPSRCTNCGTKLTWRENFPVFGWLLLRGKCRFCKSPISPEYPIVESIVGVLFMLVYVTLFGDRWRGLSAWFEPIRPDWIEMGFRTLWPLLIVWLSLVTCLVAITIIDARTYQIPLSLVWIPTLIGLAGHVGLALWMQFGTPHGRLLGAAEGWTWAIPTPGPHGWKWIGAGIGGTVGLGLSTLLLHFGVIKRSFVDYPEWEEQALKAEEERLKAAEATASPDPLAAQAMMPDKPLVPQDTGGTPELWVQYPHARREMFRELIFLAPVIGLAMAGAAFAIKQAGPWTWNPVLGAMIPKVMAPLWLQVLSGVLMGYLIGGGAIWAVRILGSLAFGKEAMGLGDVHLMAAVGACLGWIDSAFGFLGATFVGLAWWLVGLLFKGAGKRHMPFGPYLAVATVLIMFGKPVLEWMLGRLLKYAGPFPLP